MPLKSHYKTRPFSEAGSLSHMTAWYEEGRNVIWMMLHASPRPCFSEALLIEISQLAKAAKASGLTIDFWVTGSTVPNFFNLGGDLSLFISHIRNGALSELSHYAHLCIDAVYYALSNFDVGAITIAMIEGTALGGGFEAALAHEFVIAQKDVKMGFPEIAFNLYPGMGAYSIVARKATLRLAEELISTGASHTAEWFHENGLVDRIFEDGDAYQTVRTFIDEMRPKLVGIRGMLRARRRVAGVSKEELLAITDEWVESAFEIGEKDLEIMERLVVLQNKRPVTQIHSVNKPASQVPPSKTTSNSYAPPRQVFSTDFDPSSDEA